MSPYVYTCMYKYACLLCGCACMFIVYLHCHFYLIFYDRRIRFYNIMHQRYYLKFTVLEFGTLVETTRRAISSYFRSSSVGATHDFINISFLFFFLYAGISGIEIRFFPQFVSLVSLYVYHIFLWQNERRKRL